MLLNVLDSAGIAQKLSVRSQEAIADKSGIIAATGVSQTAIDANALRSGWLIENVGSNPMYVNELGVDAASAVATGSGSIKIAPGEMISSVDKLALSIAKISILGTLNETYVAREW